MVIEEKKFKILDLRDLDQGQSMTMTFGIHKASIYVFSYFPFGFEGRICDRIVSVPDHCFSFLLFMYSFS